MNSHQTTDEIFAPTEPTTEEPIIRFLDIHIYDQEPEPEELQGIESHLEPESLDESEQENTEPVRPYRKQRRILALCVAIVCLSVVIAFVMVSFLPLLTPNATITIVPITQQVRTTTTITVTTEPATGTQLQGRALAALTMTQARTVPTTGKGHQDAKAGQGSITFYNAAPYPQTVTAGTLVTGTDGVQIITDADAFLPAGTLATNGQATVSAHAIQAGPEGNIKAEDIYGSCCRLNVFASNDAFTGGQLARDYPAVAQQDINAVATRLKTSLNQSVLAALQTQVHSDETLITPLPCQQQVKPDHQAGDETVQVTITISETCTGMTYSTQAYQNRIIQIANQQAMRQLGEGYTPVGQVQSTILHARAQEHALIAFQVTLAETYAYQVSQQQQQEIKTLVAGKSKAQAITTLLHVPGVQSVSIEGVSIPPDVTRIHLVFLAMQ